MGIHVHPGRIALCGPKPRKCPFRVWGPRQTKRVGRTIEKRNPPVGQTSAQKKIRNPSRPPPLGGPLKNETPPGPVGRTIEKRNPSRRVGPWWSWAGYWSAQQVWRGFGFLSTAPDPLGLDTGPPNLVLILARPTGPVFACFCTLLGLHSFAP